MNQTRIIIISEIKILERKRIPIVDTVASMDHEKQHGQGNPQIYKTKPQQENQLNNQIQKPVLHQTE